MNLCILNCYFLHLLVENKYKWVASARSFLHLVYKWRMQKQHKFNYNTHLIPLVLYLHKISICSTETYYMHIQHK